MILWTVQMTLISIILIFLVHNLIVFFKNTLTIPKIKDLVNAPIQKYEDMYEIIHSSKKEEQMNIENVNGTPIYSLDNLLPKTDDIINTINTQNSTKSMKDELKSFLKKQMNSNVPDAKNSIDLTSTGNNFSFY